MRRLQELQRAILRRLSTRDYRLSSNEHQVARQHAVQSFFLSYEGVSARWTSQWNEVPSTSTVAWILISAVDLGASDVISLVST